MDQPQLRLVVRPALPGGLRLLEILRQLQLTQVVLQLARQRLLQVRVQARQHPRLAQVLAPQPLLAAQPMVRQPQPLVQVPAGLRLLRVARQLVLQARLPAAARPVLSPDRVAPQLVHLPQLALVAQQQVVLVVRPAIPVAQVVPAVLPATAMLRRVLPTVALPQRLAVVQPVQPVQLVGRATVALVQSVRLAETATVVLVQSARLAAMALSVKVASVVLELLVTERWVVPVAMVAPTRSMQVCSICPTA